MRSVRWGGRTASLALGLALLAPGRARAGCPSVCEATVDTPTVTPPLACMSVKVTAETCDCATFVVVKNGCADALEPVGFTFGSCASGAACTVAPGEMRSMRLSVIGTGMHPWSLEVRGGDGSHTIAG